MLREGRTALGEEMAAEGGWPSAAGEKGKRATGVPQMKEVRQKKS